MYRLLTIPLLAALLTIAATARPAEAQSGRLPVVATFSILGDIVQNVGGDRIDLRTLVGPNGDTHTFEPTPADARALANAAVVFEIGLNFEAWFPDLYRASRSGAPRVAVAEGLSLSRSDEEGDRHGEWDPHVWHDVSKAIQITYTVRDALTAADPGNQDAYIANAASYAAQLHELDTWIAGYVGCCTAPESRKLVTVHNSLNYFGARYGFTMLATALGSISTEAEPSAQQIATVVEQVRFHGVRAIFPENVSSQRLMQQIANETGAGLAPPLYTDALGPAGSAGATYYSMMVANVTTIVQALN
ncbi:MAG: metal ABC transporter solute-binding protein, Zn/Mn family [Dehalococcoidia bacterium]